MAVVRRVHTKQWPARDLSERRTLCLKANENVCEFRKSIRSEKHSVVNLQLQSNNSSK